MQIRELFINDPTDALTVLSAAAEGAGEIIFPLAEAERPGSTGGVLSVWYDETGEGDWRLGGGILIGEIGEREGRSRFDSAELYDHHAACKNTGMIRAILEGRKDDEGRTIIASSQLADETPEDPFDKRYGGGIICADGCVAISFSGLPWKWDEVMAAHVAHTVGRSITTERVQAIIEVSQNDHLTGHSEQYFDIVA